MQLVSRRTNDKPQPAVDEDADDIVDAKTLKDRNWDNWKACIEFDMHKYRMIMTRASETWEIAEIFSKIQQFTREILSL